MEFWTHSAVSDNGGQWEPEVEGDDQRVLCPYAVVSIWIIILPLNHGQVSRKDDLSILKADNIQPLKSLSHCKACCTYQTITNNPKTARAP